jgi:hypothetical protein
MNFQPASKLRLRAPSSLTLTGVVEAGGWGYESTGAAATDDDAATIPSDHRRLAATRSATPPAARLARTRLR